MLLDQFRQNGLKITPQRRVILELLAGDDSHPTAEQIYQRVLSIMPDVSRTTVYNTLRELSDLRKAGAVADRAASYILLDGKCPPHQLPLWEPYPA